MINHNIANKIIFKVYRHRYSKVIKDINSIVYTYYVYDQSNEILRFSNINNIPIRNEKSLNFGYSSSSIYTNVITERYTRDYCKKCRGSFFDAGTYLYHRTWIHKPNRHSVKN